jgi:hypothetical protein
MVVTAPQTLELDPDILFPPLVDNAEQLMSRMSRRGVEACSRFRQAD